MCRSMIWKCVEISVFIAQAESNQSGMDSAIAAVRIHDNGRLRADLF
jgi:hypothetical protein